MSNKSNPEDFISKIQFLKQKAGLPPVHSWNPPFCGDLDIRITRDGRWHYKNSPIGRKSLVKLFASILRYDDDDCYYLVTPVEKVRITVDDAPFVVITAQVRDGVKGLEYLFTTNVGDEIVLSQEHPLIMVHKNHDIPYIKVRDRLNALVSRNVFYQLVEDARAMPVSGGMDFKITSQGKDYSLGMVKDDLPPL